MIRKGAMHGIARYTYNLVLQYALENKGIFFYILVNKNNPLLDKTWPSHIKLVCMRSQWISFFEQVELPWVLWRLKADLFHAPSYVAPLIVPCALVMTIHDLNHLVLPQFYTILHQIYYRLFVKRSISYSANIITVSQFSKNEIIRNLSLKNDKIHTTYNGVADRFEPVTDSLYRSFVRDLYQLPERFIFCVANNKPHKNVKQLIKAYCFSKIEIPLVLATPPDPLLIEITEEANKKHLVHFIRFIDDEHLPALYSLAELFVYPSTYEGFGLPPLEALACGAKVLVARSSSLPEILKDFAYYTNPYDYKIMANDLQESLMSQRRDKAEARLHAVSFKWERMASKTLSIYEQSMPTLVPVERDIVCE
jgi:glycosyltransferase involved in cell wall biosynthesis